MDNNKQNTTIPSEDINKEIGGVKGQEPTIHGDWQHKGKVSDF
jgi:hypothetical protein